MNNSRTILTKMISVSRNCRFTLDLHQIFTKKLDERDLEILLRWIQIIEEERRIEIDRSKKKF